MPSSPKYTLKPVLREKFAGIIWKVEIDEANKQLAVETRVFESQVAFFSVFDYLTGRCFVKEISTDNNWWHLDRLHQNTLFLHGYVNENTPEHKGIYALDIHSGKRKWENYQLALEAVSENGLVTYNPSFQPKKLQLTDFETGKIFQSSTANYAPVFRNISFPKIINNHSSLPKYLPEHIFGPVHHCTISGKDCWAFHTQKINSFDQHLVIAQEDMILLSDILATDIPKLQPEAFFIEQNSIFCIRDRNREVISYLL